MMFGGAPKCDSCGKTAYHAEQVMGPGRKIYHKLCLKCLNCGKRLDPGSLVEHDSQPYCQRCHVVLFGTRDLRHANVLPSIPSTPPKPTPPPSVMTPSYHRPASLTASSSPRPLPPPTEFYRPPPPRSTPPPEPATPTDPTVPITKPNFREQRPISVPFAGGTKALDDRGLLKKGESPRSKVGGRIIGHDMCGGCGKRVYAAEQVFSVGHKWHRWCLKCNKCKTTLDPSKVSDREGVPYCKNCYGKEFGPSGTLR
ncbi:cysteine and glycine-rich protein [Cryptococcus neoformans]|nr:cysteine and glycine-rich protein [Cryptococcus neoformans var. grubii Bt1]OXG23653.1 cysteine and glycine-rich protein [Cryptococcus neoformans var. grubii Ze90-1]OXH31142.1 cysteine and glycine-rich protein [Cryptococcus neoformans var. grubii]